MLSPIASAEPATGTTALPQLPATTRAVGQREPMVDYTVETHDTLIGLGNTLLVSPAAWAEVARINNLPNPNLIYPRQVLAIPVRLLRGAGTPAVLESVIGDVKLDGQPATVGQTVKPGQRLVTGAASSVLLKLGDGSRVSLAPQGETVLTEHRRDVAAPGGRFALKTGAAAGSGAEGGAFASAMQLVRGSLELVVSKLSRSKPLEVTTPTAVIGVRGTQYRIHAEEGQPTRTEVLEGRVRADPLHQASLGTDVNGGQGAALSLGKAPTVVNLLPPPLVTGVPSRFARTDVRISLPDERLPLRAQVASDQRFENLVRDEKVPPGGELRLNGLHDGRWYLRLRRIDTLGIEGRDAYVLFTLKTQPVPPVGLMPAANLKLPAGPVRLQWTPVQDASRYQIEVAHDPQFKALVWRELTLHGTEATLSLAEPDTYYWHMASVDANGEQGPWSAPQPFQVRPLPATARVENRLDGGFDLVWPALPEDRHQVELASDPDFRHLLASTQLPVRRWTPPRPDAGDCPCYFRFRSIEPDGFTTPWSLPLKIERTDLSSQPWAFSPNGLPGAIPTR